MQRLLASRRGEGRTQGERKGTVRQVSSQTCQLSFAHEVNAALAKALLDAVSHRSSNHWHQWYTGTS